MFLLFYYEDRRLGIVKKKYILIILSTLFFLLWIIIGNTTIKTTNLIISSDDLPKEFSGYKIAVIADLHNKDWKNKLIDSLEKAKPDIIVIVGDLIDSSKTDLNIAKVFSDKAVQIAPVYYVSGNHEAWSNQFEDLKNILNKQVVVLEDESVYLKRNTSKILLLGVNDPDFTRANAPFYESSSLLENKLEEMIFDYKGFKVLLSHRPEYFDIYKNMDIDLVIAGHAHGGQFRIPFVGGLISPNQGLFPKYTSGNYKSKNTNMVVSRGLGNSIVPIRMNNRFELVIIELSN